MEISSSSNVITVIGNIKTVSNFQTLKVCLDSVVNQHKDVTINIKDSLSITSSVIGYFNKLILKDKINLHLKIGNSQLIELLEDLNLKSVFKVTKA